jgi:predicted dehydrogenase
MEPVRLGIIGCGVIGPSHLKLAAACPRATVVAVADRIPERARARAEAFGVPSVYFSDRELLKDPEVEAVVLAMPTGDRTPVAYRALKRGKHVLLEKPVASKAREVRRMMALRGDRVVACCSPRMTFTGHAEAAAKCVASGALGTIRVVRARAVLPAPPRPADPPPPWRQSMELNGGGILVNWSCYDLNYLMHITGWQLTPRAVMAQWWPVAPAMAAYADPASDADAHFAALIRCEDDIALSLERAEMTPSSADQAWEILGTDGALHMPMLRPGDKPHTVILERFRRGRGVTSKTIWSAKKAKPKSTGNVVDDFVRAIRTGGAPRTGLERALVMQKITDAIYASAARGRSVAVKAEKGAKP